MFFKKIMISSHMECAIKGKFYLIENVPARICQETGEQYFSPETVEHLQRTIWEKKPPKKFIETPVYEYA